MEGCPLGSEPFMLCSEDVSLPLSGWGGLNCLLGLGKCILNLGARRRAKKLNQPFQIITGRLNDAHRMIGINDA